MTRLWKNIETVTIVTLITLLVWIYAEVENVKEYQGTFTIELVAAPGQELHIAPSRARDVRVRYRCSASQRDAVQALPQPLQLRVSAQEDQDQKVDIAKNIRPFFEELGVEVLEAVDTTGRDYMDATVVALADFKLKMKVVGAETILSSSRVEPNEVRLYVAASHADEVPADAQLEVRVSEVEGLYELGTDTPHTRSLPVRHSTLLNLPYARVTPDRVDLTFVLDTKTVQVTVVPLSVSLPVGSPYTVAVGEEGNQRVLGYPIKLIGPVKAIDDIEEQLKENKNPVEASLELKLPELQNRIQSKRPVLKLPQGVKLHEPELLQPIKIKITGEDE